MYAIRSYYDSGKDGHTHDLAGFGTGTAGYEQAAGGRVAVAEVTGLMQLVLRRPVQHGPNGSSIATRRGSILTPEHQREKGTR